MGAEDCACGDATRLLVVGDDVPWVGRALEVLHDEGFCLLLDDGGDAVHRAVAFRADAALVDLAVRGASGVALCRALRIAGVTAVMAVGRRGDEAVTEALAEGADSCTTTDVSARELLARLRALLRRLPPIPQPLGVASVTGLDVDVASRRIDVNGARVTLSVAELAVLQALLRKPGRLVPRSELRAALGREDLGRSSIDVVVRRLREKLEAHEGHRRIRSVHGVGFRFDVAGAAR